MSKFVYKAFDRQGTRVEGNIEANTLALAKSQLKKRWFIDSANQTLYCSRQADQHLPIG